MKYRADIEGLRALAVIPVIFFHTGTPMFSGGYVGVDVFFVISGFVIAKSLEYDISNDKYSIWRFYSKRIRRIFPALFATVICTWIVGWFLLLPNFFENLSKSTTSTSLFASNFFFWRDSGYFSNLAHTRALLHTWSLSVEEQYYIFSPLATYAIYRYFKARWVLAFLPIIFLSFAFSVYSTSNAPTSNFFLLPSRTWELLIGALLAHATPPQFVSRWKTEVLGWFGLSLIVYTIIFFDSNTPFPGFNALYPCLGSAILLYVGISNPTVSRLLSIKPLSIIGNMSYSLYLVHWPVIVFAYFVTLRKPTSVHVVWIVLITFGLSYLSWRFVEGPFRHIDTKKHRVKILGSGVAIIVFFSGLGIWGSVNNGFPDRFPDYTHEDIPGNKEFWNRGQCFLSVNPDHTQWDADACALSEGKEEVLFWGDSFAAQYAPGIQQNKELFEHRILQYTAPGCPPVLSYFSIDRPKCASYNAYALEIIDKRKIKKVILAARWSKLKPRDGLAALQSTLVELEKRNIDVHVIGQSPEFALDVQVIGYHNRNSYKDSSVEWWETSYDKKINKELQEVIGTAHFTHPIKSYCNGDMCPYRIDGKFLFEDYAHFSVQGSIRAVQSYFPLRNKLNETVPETTIPVPRVGPWLKRHNNQKEQMKAKDPQIIFVGDSITQSWESEGENIWKEQIAPVQSVNLGIAGDRTQHSIWRIQNIAWEETTPKIAVVMIGTNNIGYDSGLDIQAGIRSLIHHIHEKSSETKIILYGIFPRGKESSDEKRIQIMDINLELSKYKWPDYVIFEDISDVFTDANGRIGEHIMYDGVHLTEEGYRMWMKSLRPYLENIKKP